MMGMKENGQIMERETRIELATNSLEAWQQIENKGHCVHGRASRPLITMGFAPHTELTE